MLFPYFPNLIEEFLILTLNPIFQKQIDKKNKILNLGMNFGIIKKIYVYNRRNST